LRKLDKGAFFLFQLNSDDVVQERYRSDLRGVVMQSVVERDRRSHGGWKAKGEGLVSWGQRFPDFREGAEGLIGLERRVEL